MKKASHPISCLIIGIAALFAACGDLNMTLSSGRVYKVAALVNGVSLDKCAILSAESKISPYFDMNIKDDPDVASLVIYLKNYMGKPTGFNIRYSLPVQEQEDADAPPTDTLEPPVAPPEEPVVPDEPAEQLAEADTPAEEAPPFEERDDSGETTADIEAGSLSVPAGTESAADSELADLPQIENSAVPQEILITVESFENELPPLSLSEDLPTGFYTIVFEVAASNGTVLNSIEKPFFYIAGKKLVVEDIISYLPGVSPTMRIVPPGEKVLLEANINADSALDTYIVWYNGKHQISEGYVADGAGRMLWTAPKQTGFQVVNVEVFPFNPSDKQGFGIRGLTHSVSLPLSARHGRISHFERLEAQASRWYRLWGNTADAKDPSSAASKLVAADGTEELWLPVSGTYGLSVGTNDVYKLPGSFFRMIKKGEGSGEILLRFAPLGYAVSETPILRAELRDESDSVCVIRLSLLEDSLVLSAAHNEEVLQTRLPVTVDGGSFINAAIDFQFFEESLSVSIGLESVETGEIESWETLSAAFVPSGAGSLQFGFSDDDDDGEASDSASVVVTEIAVLYNEVSPAAVITTEDEESAVEEEADKESDAETDTLTADVSLTPDVHDNIQQ